jgi:hypothetical protein
MRRMLRSVAGANPALLKQDAHAVAPALGV